MMRSYFLHFLFILFAVGCSSFGQKMKGWLSDEPAAPAAEKYDDARYSQQNNTHYEPKRKYGRMNRKQLESQSELDSRTGSLWVMEGQGAYLFAENKVRLIGDFINIRLDGAPRKQLDTKVNVIKKLLAKLDAPPPPPRHIASSEASKDKKKDEKKTGKKKPGDATSEAGGESGSDKSTESQENASHQKPPPEHEENDQSSFDIEFVPAKVVERLADGNYRVKGSQAFMIGRREYRVIVTGIVRASDFNEEGISAALLVDPKFDILSHKKGIN